MKILFSILIILVLSACKQQTTTRVVDDGYGLLYSVTSQQQNVDKLLWVKDPGADIRAWVEQIAAFNQEVTKQLEAWKASGQVTSLSTLGLPPAEIEARERATKRTTGELLFSTDVNLRLSLVVAQLKALGYCSDLCYAIAQETKDDGIQEIAKKWEERFKELNAAGMKLLETPAVTTPQPKPVSVPSAPQHH
ncbi:hypothetical protein [Cerasicoccus maritimus]|uniref:hypothetical protein n=1 Tax=Cerasicoccus maritimus TaxID=490089 RepID=UPI0028525E83|nr:hypothetical protein [Cerasicoccus maritimus]